MRADQGQSAVQGPTKNLGITACLGENQTALEAGQGGSGEPVGIGVAPKLASVDHGHETVSDRGLPTVEARRKHNSGVVVAFAQLTEKVSDRTASTPTELHLEFDEGVRPSHQTIPRVEPGKEVTLAIEDGFIGGVGHRPHQVGLVVEVVVKLAARCGGAGTDLIQAGPESALLGHHLGGGGNNALSGLASPLSGRLESHGPSISFVDLTVQLLHDRMTSGPYSPVALRQRCPLGGSMPVTIHEQSEQLKAAAAERLPSEVVDVFDRSIQDLLDQGLPAAAVKVGDTLESFALTDATNALVTLDQLVESGPAVIVFYRGGWCPYCNLALRTYQHELLPELAAFRARLVAISPQSPDQSLSTSEKAELDFTVLSDPGNRVARSVGIVFQQAEEVLEAQRKLGLDLAQVNAEGSTQLPRPTVLIVDKDRTVRFVDVQPDYTARTEVADILAGLTELDTN